MDCLENLVGIRGCDDSVTPTIYLDDIIPINLTHLDEIADGFQKNGEGLFADKLDAAMGLIVNDIRDVLNVEFINVVESHVVGKFGDTFKDAAPLERGIQLKRKDKCKLSGFEITDIEFCDQSATDQTILVYVDGVLDRSFKVSEFEKFSVYGDVVNILSDNTSVNVCNTENLDIYDGCLCKCNVAHDCFYARGWDGSSFSTSTFGIQISVNVVCDIDLIICNYASYLAYPLAYKVYTLILEQALISDNCSVFLSGSKQEIQNQLLIYDQGYMVSENKHIGKYWTEVNKAARNIDRMIMQADCKCCYKCKKPYYAKSYN